MSVDPDAALVSECRAGDRHAFERLVARYERPVFNAAYRILHHHEDAIDVTQTVFLRAYEHLDHYDPGQRFFSWLYRIAINEAIDVANDRGRTGSDGETELDRMLAGRPAPDEVTARVQLDAGMQSALMALKLEYRTVIVLKHLQDCSSEDIAAILDCPVKTVKSRLYTARQALRDVLERRGLV